MISDPDGSTICIPIRIVNGEPRFFYREGGLPALRDGTVGDLIVPTHALVDEAIRAQLEKHDRRELFPSGTVLLIQVQKPDHRHGLVELQDHEIAGSTLRTCVRVVLEEPLRLNLRGTKRAQLMPARCSIPELDRGANSLNEAYSVVSQEYERWRRSHSGNVFKKVLFLDSGKTRPNLWRKLDILRARKEAAHERLLFGAPPQKADPGGV